MSSKEGQLLFGMDFIELEDGSLAVPIEYNEDYNKHLLENLTSIEMVLPQIMAAFLVRYCEERHIDLVPIINECLLRKDR